MRRRESYHEYLLKPSYNGEINEAYISVWSTLQTNRNQNGSNRVHNSLWCIRNINTFLKLFLKQKWHFQKVTAKHYEVFPGKLGKAILLYLSDVKLYSKSLLTGISVNTTFRTVFDFKKLKIIYCWDIYHCEYRHLTFSNNPYP